jgi:hypothetical protein
MGFSWPRAREYDVDMFRESPFGPPVAVYVVLSSINLHVRRLNLLDPAFHDKRVISAGRFLNNCSFSAFKPSVAKWSSTTPLRSIYRSNLSID